MQPIKFGTDGWRAVIADQFTFDNLARVAQATAQWLGRDYPNRLRVVIGYDTRFQGRAFSEHAARVLAARGIQVILSDGFATTPAVSWATQAYGCSAGLVVTASHNPPEYNGYKIKAYFGGPATPEMIAAVEGELDRLDPLPDPLPAFDALLNEGRIERRDINTAYLDVLRRRLDVAAIRRAGLRIAHDAMYGAGQGLIRRLLDADQVVELHAAFNPGFDGQAPEPIEKNLGDLAQTVVRERCDVGIANDGDADRVGMFDERGVFVDSHQLLCLLVKYLHEERGLQGDIVKTFSTTHMLDRMGERYGLRVHTTPIGFKYIASQIVEGDVLVGGEESGGMAVKGHIPERDGIYIGLLVTEMMVKRGKALSELVQELYDEFGPHYTYRTDVHTTEARKQEVLRRLRDEGGLRTIGGHDVTALETMDGYRHRTDGGGWLLVRPSGTEPVLRIYAEAPSEEAARALVADALKQFGLSENGH